ncbi:CCHC-type domain-containing protein [Abeliophyllum distichum]|uniref:CCHC-type domain-containing protein n=1 Tax=Abeliophyllum distichum TaxID=126358 RepID=A0ABD1T226_9LAMI
MNNFRKNLENIYETSQDLGLLNVLLAFEDSELDQVISIVRKIDIGNKDIVMTAKSVGDEPNDSRPLEIPEKSDSSSEDEEEIIVHERFNTSRGGIVFRDPKPEEPTPMEYETGPNRNPVGGGKRPVGDRTPRPLPTQEIDPDFLLHKPKKNPTDIKFLDLDCVLSPETVIEDWYNNIMIAMIINKEIIRSGVNSWNFVIASTRGNVKAFLRTITDEAKNAIFNETAGDNPEFIKRIVEQIYKQFTGQTYEVYRKTRSIISEAEALTHLEKMSICDMCYFEEFTCEFSKYYYIAGVEHYKTNTEKFMRKLPYPYSDEVINLFNNAISWQEGSKDNLKVNLQIEGSLGLAITSARNLLAEKCKEAQLLKTSKVIVAKNSRLCCNNYLDRIPSQYGCMPEKKYRKTKRQKPRTKKYKFKKYKQPYKKKFFKRKKYFKKYSKSTSKIKKGDKAKDSVKKFCPQNKKNCRCWLCNESGHYANECPARLGNEDRVRLLTAFERKGFYLVEDPSDTESLYYITTDSGSDSEDSSYSSDDE